MEKQTGTTFKVFLLGSPRRAKGFIKLWKHKGKNQNHHPEPFNNLTDIPGRIRAILDQAGIEWPPKKTRASK